MPPTVKQVKQGRLTKRAKNDAETPMRRIRAARDLVQIPPGFTRDPTRLAKKIANLFITSGEVGEDVRAAAAKLLELVSSHAVNENEPENDDEVQMPAEFHIKRPKTRKAPKGFQEAILNGGDLYLFHYWEPEVGEGWPASSKDFESAKIGARDLLWPAIDQTRPRYCMEGGSITTQRTEYGEEVLSAFKSLVAQILAAPTEYNEPEPATPLASPTDYGVPFTPTVQNIKFHPELSVPPIIGPEQSLPAIRVTCKICQSTDKGLVGIPHDCSSFQNL